MAEKQRKLTDSTMITIRNNSGGGIYFKNDMGILRSWEKPSSIKKISLIELAQALSHKGVYVLFDKGSLIIDEDNAGEIREYLGLPELDEYVLTLKEVKDLLHSKDYKELRTILKWSDNYQKDTIVQTAISEKVDANTISVIKEMTGQDITSLIIVEKEEEIKEETKEVRPPRKKK
jgi:hypothetical protein